MWIGESVFRVCAVGAAVAILGCSGTRHPPGDAIAGAETRAGDGAVAPDAEDIASIRSTDLARPPDGDHVTDAGSAGDTKDTGVSSEIEIADVQKEDSSPFEVKPTDVPDSASLLCEPGATKCDGESVVLECSPDGQSWEEHALCNPVATGKVCAGGSCVPLCALAAGELTYLGCEFWPVDLDNAFVPGGRNGFYDAAGEQFAVVVSNPSHFYPAAISVLDSDGPVPGLPGGALSPGELRVYNLPRRDADGTILAPLAYRFVSSIPIAAYQFNPLENVDVFSNDASLLLPTETAGTEYWVMTREQTFGELRSFLTVVAVEEGTTQVTVDVTAKTLAGGQSLPALAAGGSLGVEMNQFDVLNIETDEVGGDLTGSHILATKRVVVFGGSEAANAPNTNHCLVEPGKMTGVCEWDMAQICGSNEDCTVAGLNTCCADHLEQQLVPVSAWGTVHPIAKTWPRNLEADVYRVLASADGTNVSTVPSQGVIPPLNAGEWVDFESAGAFAILSDKPILVGQFIASEQAPAPNVNGVPQPGDAGIGDPAFLLVVPAGQFMTDYVFLAPDKYEYDYVTIIAPASASVWFDCPEVLPEEVETLCDPLAAASFEIFEGTDWKHARLEVQDGGHRVHADAPVGVYVYGYDQYVSYGYPAGMKVQPLP